MMFEPLESRRLMSVSFNAATGTVTVLGMDDILSSDAITARVSNNRFVVSDNGRVSSFAASQVKRIVVRMGAGSGTVTLDPTVTVPSDISTGATASDEVSGPVVRGGSGPDTIRLLGYNGEAHGGAGNDTFLVDAVYAAAFGDAGKDAFRILGGTHGCVYHGGTGNDTLDYSSSTTGGLLIRDGGVSNYHSGTGIPPTRDSVDDPQRGGDFYDGIDTFVGTAKNDFIYGTAGANYIDGRGGNDYIRGGGGNDVLVGGSGADALYGDSGDDQFFARDSVKDFLSGGAGYDRRRSDAADVLNSVEGTV